MNTNLDIEVIEKGKFRILKLRGRIDANWSLRLSEAVKELIRGGAYDIVLDAAEVDYISSAGVRVLLMSFKELKKLGGSFGVYRPGENVVSIINLMGLSELFDCSKFERHIGAAAADNAAHTAGAPAPDYGTVNGIDINVLFRTERSATVKISGDLDRAGALSYSKADARRLANGPKTLSFGLGALGPDQAAAAERGGEFLSICGFAAYMPSDGSKKPDYMIAGNDFIPEINYLYCASCECEFSAAFTFKSAEKGAAVKFSDLVKTAHSVAGGDDLVIVVAGETSGLVGASLAAPPARRDAGDNSGGAGPFDFPQIRDNFIITSEPAYAGHIVLCAGLSSLKPAADPAAGKFMRPLAANSIVCGHFHAAVFDFTPLKKNCADPAELAAALYEKGSPEAVMHLINDWRAASGAGETGFASGTCWALKVFKYETDIAGVEKSESPAKGTGE